MSSVLLVSPGVDGGDIGEAWVAYQWASGLSRNHEVTLLTYRKRGRPSAVDQLPAARVVEWDELPLIGRAERFNSLLKPWYPHFYFLCRSWLRKALKAGEHFDVAHQPVPVAMRYPSPLTGFGIPYILGPVGGSMESPAGFSDNDTSKWYMDLRRLDRVRIERDSILRRSYSQAAVVFGIAPYVADLLSSVSLQRFEVMSETAVTALPSSVDRRGRSGPLKLLFVGRLIRTKGARDVISAMAQLGDIDVSLDIVGDGFDRVACEELVGTLELSDRVNFHGVVRRDAVDGFYKSADIFVFPSYREPGGNVPFEAMSYGLPMIVSDRGGPGYVVTDSCGIRIAPRNPDDFAADIARAIRELWKDPERRILMGECARERVRDIGTWDLRIAQIDRVYECLGGAGTDRS